MKVIMHSNEDLELIDFDSPELHIEPRDPEAHYSAIQMFSTSLGLCTYSVLVSYAERIDAATDDLSVRLRWSYGEDPFRISRIEMDIHWPGLPSSRQKAAQRAAAHCTIHNTLAKSPEVVTNVTASEGSPI